MRGKPVDDKTKEKAIALAKKISAEAAANRLGISRSSVYKWILEAKQKGKK